MAGPLDIFDADATGPVPLLWAEEEAEREELASRIFKEAGRSCFDVGKNDGGREKPERTKSRDQPTDDLTFVVER